MRNPFYIILFALLLVFLLCACSPPTSDNVNIIGGADGPTAIYVTDDEDSSPSEE